MKYCGRFVRHLLHTAYIRLFLNIQARVTLHDEESSSDSVFALSDTHHSCSYVDVCPCLSTDSFYCCCASAFLCHLFGACFRRACHNATAVVVFPRLHEVARTLETTNYITWCGCAVSQATGATFCVCYCGDSRHYSCTFTSLQQKRDVSRHSLMFMLSQGKCTPIFGGLKCRVNLNYTTGGVAIRPR